MDDFERSQLDRLLCLIEQHPKLLMIPMISSEIFPETFLPVVDDEEYRDISHEKYYRAGRLDKVEIDSYIITNGRIYLFNDDSYDLEEVLNGVDTSCDWYMVPFDEAKEAFQNLPWQEAIVVYFESYLQNR